MGWGWTVALFAAGSGAVAAAAIGSVLPPPTEGAGLHLVIAPPLAGGAEAVILRAGGAVVGPATAPFAAVSGGVTAARLFDAGAWAVTGLPIPIACDVGVAE